MEERGGATTLCTAPGARHSEGKSLSSVCCVSLSCSDPAPAGSGAGHSHSSHPWHGATRSGAQLLAPPPSPAPTWGIGSLPPGCACAGSHAWLLRAWQPLRAPWCPPPPPPPAPDKESISPRRSPAPCAHSALFQPQLFKTSQELSGPFPSPSTAEPSRWTFLPAAATTAQP